MVDISAISGLASSLKASSDIAKAMLGIRDELLIREKAIELTSTIMSAQASAMAAQATQAELVERVRDLEKQIVKLEHWETEKNRYQLVELGVSVFAYQIKAGMEAGEPSHRLCAQCYQHGRKSILQGIARAGTNGMVNHLVCHACSADIITGQTPYQQRAHPTRIRGDLP